MLKFFILGAVAGAAFLALIVLLFVPMGTLYFDHREDSSNPLVYAEFPKRVQRETCKIILLKSRRIF